MHSFWVTVDQSWSRIADLRGSSHDAWMRDHLEHGFVLHTRPWRENSLMLEVLTPTQGRIGMIARGLRGRQRLALRAALQPFQWLQMRAKLRGELAVLSDAEPLDVAPRLQGQAMLAGFYVNELLIRLIPRHVPIEEGYHAYATVRERLRDTQQPLAWTLRRFERDILHALGVGFEFIGDAQGQALVPTACYRLDPHSGPHRLDPAPPSQGLVHGATGRALQALGQDVLPPAEDLASLRRAMRAVLLHHLGGRRLKSWEMIEGLLRFHL